MKIKHIQTDYHYEVRIQKEGYAVEYCKPNKGKPFFNFYDLPNTNEVSDKDTRNNLKKGVLKFFQNKESRKKGKQ